MSGTFIGSATRRRLASIIMPWGAWKVTIFHQRFLLICRDVTAVM
jgi:hypothetical protein